MAAYYNHIDILKLLLKYGSEPNVVSNKNETALLYAIKNNNVETDNSFLFYPRKVPQQ